MTMVNSCFKGLNYLLFSLKRTCIISVDKEVKIRSRSMYLIRDMGPMYMTCIMGPNTSTVYCIKPPFKLMLNRMQQ